MLIDKSEEGEVKWNYSYSFDLEWVATNCSDCTTNGGYCGYKGAPDNKFQCLCDDRPHSRSYIPELRLKTTLKDLLMVIWGYFAQNPRPPVRDLLIPIWIYGAQNPRLVVVLLSVLGYEFYCGLGICGLASYLLPARNITSMIQHPVQTISLLMIFPIFIRTKFNSRNIFPSNVKLYVQNDAVAALASGTMGTSSYGFTEDGREARTAGAGPVLGDWGSHFL
ncbi:hypothetical protein POM88_030505 [Heracleum sosnowskyi]|uniref:Wall-associated receptor kinase C-terminal domain-containing protein n=1 Tax=Heracleum sosnowskyi TaxID=360622 RepID=A0AAD8MIN5_9APIA|nr:hypothetical protein POM88_030505 [Heracleum sosnowskyi]